MVRLPQQRLAVLVDTQFGYCRDVVLGISRFVHLYSGIEMRVFQYHDDPKLEQLLSWDPDGAVIFAVHHDRLDILRRNRLPFVLISSHLEPDGEIRIGIDERLIGRQAARAFLQLGYRHFAYVGEDCFYSRERLAGYVDQLGQYGYSCAVYDIFDSQSQVLHGEPVEPPSGFIEWLMGLQRPLALFCCNDDKGLSVASICQRAGLVIPHEISLMGVDNDEYVCQLARPALTSIRTPARRIGYFACQHLTEMFCGRKDSDRIVLLPPEDVVCRQSTNRNVFGDDELQSAIAYIHDHVSESFGVEQMAEHLGVCRRVIERKFRKVLQTTPMQYIHRVRIEQVRRLLRETDLSLSQIAVDTLFSNVSRMNNLFMRLTGMSPLEYRRRYELPAGCKG